MSIFSGTLLTCYFQNHHVSYIVLIAKTTTIESMPLPTTQFLKSLLQQLMHLFLKPAPYFTTYRIHHHECLIMTTLQRQKLHHLFSPQNKQKFTKNTYAGM